MKIAAFSDSHGRLSDVHPLPIIEPDTDVVCIAGDISPVIEDRNVAGMTRWLTDVFFTWVESLDVKKVIFIAGNHDFQLSHLGDKVYELINESNVKDKLIYLRDESYEFDGVKFYGTPWVKGLKYFVYNSNNLNNEFSKIPDCDVLITHIPPMVDKVGCSYPYQPYERNFGSKELTKVLDEKQIKIDICGHIHTGIHGGVQYGNTMIYNVSLINEDYNEAYDVTYIDI